jgi:hypothetical protein
MIRQFVVAPELQQFLASIPSSALVNVVWSTEFPDGDPVLPFNPDAVRRVLIFDQGALGEEATPLIQYNGWMMNLNASGQVQITFRRGTEW